MDLSRLAWATQVMALYTPEELANFDAIFTPPDCPAVREAISHEEMLRQRAERHAKWTAEHEAELLAERALRTPEAVCRGYSDPDVVCRANQEAIPAADLSLPGDHMRATRGWLHHHLGDLRGFERIHLAEELKDGHARKAWRAAAGSLVSHPSGRIDHPAAYLLRSLSRLASGEGRDIRGKAGYFASDTWPDGLILFAGVALPDRRK